MERKNCFFLKLIPPRSTFPGDMTEEEGKIMKEHAVYWQELMAKGICHVYGPVLDPNGAYGIGILEIGDDKAILAEIQNNDPSLKSGLNRLEIYPMIAILKT